MTPAALAESRTDAALPESSSPIAGRIDAPGSQLEQAKDAWLDNLRHRGKKPKSIDACRQTFDRAAAAEGWTRLSDITAASVLGYLGSMRDKGEWLGTTYNRNLSLMKSFTKFLAGSRLIEADPLLGAQRAVDDGEDGSRAATLEEARAIIKAALDRQRSTSKSKGNRALYWLCLFAAASRFNEPASWERRHLILDHVCPHISWTKDIQKNHKQAVIALAPELAYLLRQHLQDQDRELHLAGLPPAGPRDKVFPIVPNDATFGLDREASQIVHKDVYGAPFTPHSARKFFSTVMTGVGVPEKMVDRLMRHSGRVEHRYYRPELHEMAEAMKALPWLWPEDPSGRRRDPEGPAASPFPSVPPHVDNSVSGFRDLTRGVDRAQHVDATRTSSTQPASSSSAAQPRPNPSEWHPSGWQGQDQEESGAAEQRPFQTDRPDFDELDALSKLCMAKSAFSSSNY